MAMMQIRIVPVRMNELVVSMDMRMRFAERIGGRVSMLMMLVMPVQMVVEQRFVPMQMGVVFGEM
jgi:hypothetical protein